MSPSRNAAFAAFSALTIVTACGQPSADPDTDVAAFDIASDTQPAPTTDSANISASSTLWQGGAQIGLDIQVPHPNGVVLQLTSLQSGETETAVGVRVINGDDREVHLNRYNNRDGYLVVESGERLFLSPPTGNPRLSVQPGQVLEGELVFLGRLPETQSAVLVLNENSSTDNANTQVPGFRINLDLAGLAPARTAS